MRETGLIVYQAARAFDLLTADQPKAAADALGLLLVYLDQLALDSGSPTVAYLMTLLPDPPQGFYAEGPAPPGGSLQAFTPLADQSWVTSALGFLREMDLISTRRAEAKAVAKPPKKPLVPPPLPPSPKEAEEAMTRKQQRAAKWAAQKAAAAAATK